MKLNPISTNEKGPSTEVVCRDDTGHTIRNLRS
jgi:hypothetical protein